MESQERSCILLPIWSNDEIIVERIEANEVYFDSLISNVKDFIYGILSEIIGKWYTRKPFVDPTGVIPMTGPKDGDIEDDYDDEDYEKVWCYCQQPSHGTMIFVDNNKFTIKWFHCDCLRIRKPPKGKWRCPSCRKVTQNTNDSVKSLTNKSHLLLICIYQFTIRKILSL